ncbi:MAG TPA: hypothetical protein VMT67_13970 [Terriglobales bacterium]|nr:hypothetical protein [Terriglobales bacterium]
MGPSRKQKSFFREHSLSLVAAAILVLWVVLYCVSSPSGHIGSFFGNAIADWSGVLLTVLATKGLFEIGSGESKRPPHRIFTPVRKFLEEHSLTIFLVVTGLAWVAVFAKMDPQSRWGQVVGNIVSEWTQVLGLVWLTKRFFERGSKEGGAR